MTGSSTAMKTTFAAPRRGYVLSRAIEDVASPLRSVAAALTIMPIEAEVRSAFALEAGTRNTWTEREAWFAIGAWLVVAGTRRSPTTSMEFLECFTGQPLASASLGSFQTPILSVAHDPRLHDLLPYVLDAHGPGSRLSVRRDPGTKRAREHKKANGVFYTPADVADFMVGTVVSGKVRHQPPTFLDPAVGTGVFLRAALKDLKGRFPEHDHYDLAKTYLFGLDIDDLALDGAAFILLGDILRGSPPKLPAIQAWRALRMNLVCIDSLTVTLSSAHKESKALGTVFPKLADGADIVIGNPPYAALGAREDIDDLAARLETIPATKSSASDLFPAFIEQMIKLGSSEGSGAMVVPLSIASNGGGRSRRSEDWAGYLATSGRSITAG